MATIRDIARLAGVSKSTVSNVLNGNRERFSEATRRRVLKAIEMANYRPNAIARGLASNHTHTIGVLMSDVSNEPYAQALRAIDRVLTRAGYNLFVANTDDDVAREQKSVGNMLDHRIDGIVFVSSSGVRDNSHLTQLAQSNFPIVLINRFLPHGGVDIVEIDNAAGMRDAVVHLAGLGHRRIGCIHLPVTGRRTTQAAVDRLNGFREGLRASGLAERPQWVLEGAHGEANGLRTGRALTLTLLRQKPRVSALACANDFLAIGAIRAAGELGLRVPEDLAVTGHDNTVAGRYHSPDVTTVEQPMATAAAHAAKRLIQRLSAPSDPFEQFNLKVSGKLVVRASTVPAGSTAHDI